MTLRSRRPSPFALGCALVLCGAPGCAGKNNADFSDSNAAGSVGSAGTEASAGSAGASSGGVGGASNAAGSGSGGSTAGTGGSAARVDAGGSEPTLPSQACGSGVTPPADGYHDIQANGEARRFIVHLPPTYDGSHAFPAITTYHSKGDDATQWDSVKFYYKTAAGASNVLVYMEALPDATLAGARSFERDPADDLIYVDAVTAWLTQNVCFDQHRLFALGHSNGATFVQDLGCHRGHVFRAVAMHAGNAGDTTGCDGPLPAWVSFGDGDNAGLVAISKARSAFWAMTNGCSATTTPTDPAPCVRYADCTSSDPVELCEDTLGDHKWSAWMSGATAEFFANF